MSDPFRPIMTWRRPGINAPLASTDAGGRLFGCLREGFSAQPKLAAPVEFFNLRAFQTRHILLDRIPDLRLQIGQMTVADRKLPQQAAIKLQRGAGVDRINPVLFIRWAGVPPNPNDPDASPGNRRIVPCRRRRKLRHERQLSARSSFSSVRSRVRPKDQSRFLQENEGC